MSGWLRLMRGVDRLNAWAGRAVSWLALVMVLIGSYNAIVRYLGRFFGWNLSSNLYLELQWYLFSVLFLLAAAHALHRGAHVRVDVLYARLSPRRRVWVDLVGAAVLLLPFCALVLIMSWPTVMSSWRVLEGSPDPGGLPRFPLKTLILVAFAQLALQGVAEMIRGVAQLRGVLPFDRDAVSPGEGV